MLPLIYSELIKGLNQAKINASRIQLIYLKCSFMSCRILGHSSKVKRKGRTRVSRRVGPFVLVRLDPPPSYPSSSGLRSSAINIEKLKELRHQHQHKDRDKGNEWMNEWPSKSRWWWSWWKRACDKCPAACPKKIFSSSDKTFWKTGMVGVGN